MSCLTYYRATNCLVTLSILFVLFCTKINAEAIMLLDVGDITAFPGETDVRLPIYLTNSQDSVTEFAVWLQLDRPDIALFNLSFDTVGTLLSGMPLDIRSLSGFGFDIQISVDSTEPAQIILPQDGQIPLIFALLDIIPTSLPELEEDRHVNIFPYMDGNSYLSFLDSVWATDCWVCLSWCGQECCNLKKVSTPPGGSYENCDSTFEHWEYYYNTDSTIVVEFNAGSITLIPSNLCGDGDNNLTVNISDLTFMIDFMFRNGTSPFNPALMDLDGSGEINITDLTTFVCYLFQACDPPDCGF